MQVEEGIIAQRVLKNFASNIRYFASDRAYHAKLVISYCTGRSTGDVKAGCYNAQAFPLCIIDYNLGRLWIAKKVKLGVFSHIPFGKAVIVYATHNV